MPSGEESWRRLVEELAAADAPDVIQEARAGARVRVRAALEDAFVGELLKAVGRPEPEISPAVAVEQGEAYWVYCVVPSEWATELAAGLHGIEPGSSVEALAEGHLAALLSRVPLADYGDEQLRRHLEDISWLERTARAHEAVQQDAMRQGPLVPLRMCTIYRDLGRVRRVLRDRAELFAENLTAVEDCAEWGIKVFLDLERIPEPSPTEPEPAGASGASGADYLAGRQRERDRVRETDERCLQCAEDVHQTVSELARQDRVNPVQSAEAHGRDAEMVLNEAYLVEDDRIEELQGAVRELFDRWAPHGLLVELTGPWPPYNFVSDSAGLIS